MSRLKKYSDNLQEQVTSLDEVIARAKDKKKNSLPESVGERLNGLLKIRKKLLSKSNRSFRILSKPENQVLETISAELSKLPTNVLLDHASRITLAATKQQFAIELLSAENKYLLSYFKEKESGRIEKSSSKQDGKVQYKDNKELLSLCLEKLKSERQRELEDKDYARFRTIVISHPAPFQPKPRENADDKMLSPEDRRINLEIKKAERIAHNGWAPSSIYEFWKKATKLNATTKKPSTLK